MSSRSIVVLAAVVTFGGAGLSIRHAAGHHSIASEYDVAQTVTISGVISSVQLVNPHVWIEVKSANDAPGAATHIEMAAPNALVRRGIDPRVLFAVGRAVVVEGLPALNRGNRVSGRVLVSDGVRYDVSDAFGWQQLTPTAPTPPPVAL
jgi:hypothetical protein